VYALSNRTSLNKFSASKLVRFGISVVVTLVVCLLTEQAASGQEEAAIKVHQTVKLDSVGNATMDWTIKLPTNRYTELKASTPNLAVLMRTLGAGRTWGVLEDLKGEFKDFENAVSIHYTQRGFARVERGDEWVVPIDKAAKPDIVDIRGNVAILNETTASPLGMITLTIHVIAPETSSRLAANGHSITYHFTPTIIETTSGVAPTFTFDHKQALMSCLAKCYGNEQFNELWAGRSRFDNTSGQTLTDYRVRFGIGSFGYWSQWNHTSKVYPGQTIVDPFFPVFDLDKVNTLTGTRLVMVQVEYEYRRPNGELVKNTESFPVQLLGRNEALFRELASSEVITFEDSAEYMPAVMASFTTPTDPVIQQLAGRISGLAGGANASGSNEDALKFLKAMYDFMGDNKIAYQTPPTFVNGEQRGQHIKYGRDVLQNHAGTCIDLALLWASTCEAVGLKTGLVLLRNERGGHCFPLVQLPGGEIVAIESTVVGKATFEQALTYATKKELPELNPALSMKVDISLMRKLGVQCLDLPPASPNFLSEQGYRFEVRYQSPDRNDQQRQPQRSQTNGPSLPRQFVGAWFYSQEEESSVTRKWLYILADGRFAVVTKVQSSDGETSDNQSEGRWGVYGDRLVLDAGDWVDRFAFQVQDDRLSLYCLRCRNWTVYGRITQNGG
jgi:hypothetical protein